MKFGTLNKFLLLFVFSYILFPSISTSKPSERQHKLNLVFEDGKTTEFSVDKIEKDFPVLNKLKTSLQGEPVQQFEGVLISDFVAKYAPAGTTKLKVSATNNYTQTLTDKDWKEWGAFLAFKSDGKTISTKTRGTFRVIYDYEKFKSNKEIISILETNSVWQVIKIEFIK